MFDYKSTPQKQLEMQVLTSDRSCNQAWVKDELYAIAYMGLAEEYLEKVDTHAYANPTNSSVLYLIGATDEKPTDYPANLEIHTGRIGWPDIDIDIDDRKRDQLIERTKEVYGEDKVAHIGTFSTIRAGNAIRDAARVLGIPYAKGDKVAKLVPDPVLGVSKTLDESIQTTDFKKEIEKDQDVRDIVTGAKALEGLLRNTGIHAAGVIVADAPVTDYVPVMQRPGKDSKQGPIVTQWDMHRVEQLGQLKIDFLGLRNLGLIDACLDNIEDNRGEEFDIDDVSLEDEETYQMLRKGDSVGCFQVECLAGDMVIDGKEIQDLYRNGASIVRSISFSDGRTQREGVKEVVHSGKKQIYKVYTNTGNFLRASAKHNVMTKEGWRHVDELSPGTSVLIDLSVETKRTCVDCKTRVTDGFYYKCDECIRQQHTVLMQPTKRLILRQKYRAYREIRDHFRFIRSLTEDGRLNKYEKRAKARKEKTFNTPITRPNGKGKYVMPDLDFAVRSSAEADLARLLKSFGLTCEYEKITFKVEMPDGSIENYTPDFWVEEHHRFYDVINKLSKNNTDVIEVFRNQNPDIDVEFINPENLAYLKMHFPELASHWDTFLLPRQHHWAQVTSVIQEGIEDTYDLVLEGPTHNFNANGFVVHNSPGMRSLMLSLQPDNIEDIMSLIALYRPGPLGSGMDKAFVNRKHGREEIESYHPLLDELLEPTYGIMLYQEDILNVTRILAGFSASEADALRKVVGKKLMDKISEYREKFVQGCIDTHNVAPSVANKIYSDIEYFGGYGFNRSHAAAYGVTSYLTAYFKCHYPAEYMAALLSSIDDKDTAGKYLNECRRMGIDVLPPSINRSAPGYKVMSDNEIMVGFSAVSGVGESIVESIMSSRKGEDFKTIHDFMRRCDVEVLKKSTIEHLVGAGCMDELVQEYEERSPTKYEKMSVLEREREELGLFLTEHPLLDIWQDLETKITVTIDELEALHDGERVVVGGIITKANKKTTKRGQTMYILGIEDLTGHVDEVLVFPGTVKDNVFKEGEIVTMAAKLVKEGDIDNQSIKLFFYEMDVYELPENSIHIHLQQPPTSDTIKDMNNIIVENPGDTIVYLSFEEFSKVVTLRFNKTSLQSIEDKLASIAKEKVTA